MINKVRNINLVIFALVLIIVLSVALRFSGTSPGYPPYHSDEGISYSAAVSMIKNGNLDPLRYDYPSVVPLTNYIAFRTVFIPYSWTKYYLTNLDKIVDGYIRLPMDELTYKKVFESEILGNRKVNALFWGRYTTAFIGVLSVFLVFIVGRKLKSSAFGLIASALLAVNYRHVLNSHLGLPDIYNGFFLLISFWVTLKLWEKPSAKKYLIAAFFAGLSFSVKYQFFSFFPLLIVHLFLTFSKKKWEERVKYLFRREAIAIPFIIVLVFVALNPYMFVKIEETIAWLVSVSGKYRAGKNFFDFYPYSYLYHFGLGLVVSILVLIGSFLTFLANWEKALLLLSVVIPFFYVTTYATGGGFYTRNFVTITPFLVILAAVPIYSLKNIPPKKIGWLSVFVVTVLVTIQSSRLSFVVAKEYRDEWNVTKTQSWIGENIPKGSKIAAHSSVRLPKEMERLPYEQRIAFSVDEFREMGADFAVASLDWVKVDYYWWMAQSTENSLKYWDKPVEILDQMYASRSVRELARYNIYSELNSPRAPDSDYVVAKIPQIDTSDIEEFVTFDFGKGQEDWSKKGTGLEGLTSMLYKDQALVINKSNEPNFNARFDSPLIDVTGWKGFQIVYEIKTNAENVNLREGFLVASFYKDKDDAESGTNQLSEVISSRNSVSNDFISKSFSGLVPNDSKYLTIGFHSYKPTLSKVSLSKVVVNKARVELDYGEYTPAPLELTDDQLFPESHGNL